MKKIKKRARAKLNLFLAIINKRQDGYHNIESIMQKINFYDTLKLQKTQSNTIEIQCNKKELEDSTNIISKAYFVLKEKYPKITGIKVNLKKKIPMQAGMGGGSSDCASFLQAVNQLFSLKIKKEELTNIGKNLGADVPGFLEEENVRIEGIGEKVTILKNQLKCYYVIIKPDFCCNTKMMYQKIDAKGTSKKGEQECYLLEKAMQTGNIKLLVENLYNEFEEVMEQKEEIEKLKQELETLGAKGSLMTGSGSCVFGVFEKRKTAKQAYQELKNKYTSYFCSSYTKTS